jgi:hypothetical protein
LKGSAERGGEKKRPSGERLFTKREGRHMTRGIRLSALMVGVFACALAYATSPSPEAPSTSTVEAVVKNYVDKDFIMQELPPPPQCEHYAEKLMFAYDWDVVIHKVGPYDPARKLLPVTAMVRVRCGPFHPPPHPSGEGEAADFPLRTETPIDFQLMVDPEQAQQWKVHDATLWKSKQSVIGK